MKDKLNEDILLFSFNYGSAAQDESPCEMRSVHPHVRARTLNYCISFYAQIGVDSSRFFTCPWNRQLGTFLTN